MVFFVCGQCDAVCGWGKEKRKVRCITQEGQRVSRSNCDIMYKPDRVQKCYAGPCKFLWNVCCQPHVVGKFMAANQWPCYVVSELKYERFVTC